MSEAEARVLQGCHLAFRKFPQVRDRAVTPWAAMERLFNSSLLRVAGRLHSLGREWLYGAPAPTGNLELEQRFEVEI